MANNTWITPAYPGNNPTPIAPMAIKVKLVENKRQPPLFKIKITAIMAKIPAKIILKLNIFAASSAGGRLPPKSLKVFLAVLNPGYCVSAKFTAMKNCKNATMRIMPANL